MFTPVGSDRPSSNVRTRHARSRPTLIRLAALVVAIAMLAQPPVASATDATPVAHRPLAASDCAGGEFWDVPADTQFCAEITWLASTGVTRGYPDAGQDLPGFHPRAVLTRQAMAAFLRRFALSGTDDPRCTGRIRLFTDVRAGGFCGPIEWSAGAGIAEGRANGTFGPVAVVTRQSMAAFLFRLTHRNGTEPAPCIAQRFWDVPAGSAFCGEIAWLAETLSVNLA